MSSPKFWREIPQRYRMEAGKCSKCGKVFFPPRLVCSSCKGQDFETIRLAGTGRVATYTVIRVSATQFADEVPFAVGVIDMDEGVRLTSQIVDCDPESVKTGMPVKIEFRKVQEEGKAGILCYGYKCVPA
ncbi:MAG: Zn-ribbon domain-containing OB-fold protein [Candidatus Eisenbacteria sp.]|nr:Zn-ribbon domain-containing OB-fold protein [Candidatus Eisenbacteria bacterium]